jgi:hypothetical protein
MTYPVAASKAAAATFSINFLWFAYQRYSADLMHRVPSRAGGTMLLFDTVESANNGGMAHMIVVSDSPQT